MVLGLRHFAERVGDGVGQPLLDYDGGEELFHVQPGVALVFGHRPPESPGTLYISNRRVVWLSDTDTAKGYAVDFLDISLHAVSRDPEAYPLPCIYTQIDTECGTDEESEESDLEDLELSKITEMRLVPSDPSQLDALFDIFCQCAELNPDPHEEGEEENNWIFGEGMADNGSDSEWQQLVNLANPIGYANGNHDLACDMRELHINDQRFEDAEEAEEDSSGGRQ